MQTKQRLFIHEEILYECKFESILALYVAKEWKELCAVYKMSTLSALEVFGVHGSLTRKKDISCKKCVPGVLLQDEDKKINLDGDGIEVVDRFSYPGDVLSTEGGAQEAVTSRIRSTWKILRRF